MSSVGMVRIFEAGKQHALGDARCAACDSGWPQVHRDATTPCSALVHCETFPDPVPDLGGAVVKYYCEACGLDPF